MAAPVDITTGVQSVSATGAVTGTLDTSGLTGDYSVFIGISGLTAGKTVIVSLEDTANASAFSDAIAQWVEQFSGAYTSVTDTERSRKSYQIPGCRFGVANAKLRINVLSITATPGLKIHAWIQQ